MPFTFDQLMGLAKESDDAARAYAQAQKDVKAVTARCEKKRLAAEAAAKKLTEAKAEAEAILAAAGGKPAPAKK